jgi:Sodium:dicarboxylate symporter family
MRILKRISLTSWIFIALVAGILVGAFFPNFSKGLAPISDIFLRLIKSIVGPLLFGTLVAGIASAGELKTMGRIAVKAFVYFELATTVALAIGLITVNLMQPGAGLRLPGGEAGTPVQALAKPASLSQILEHAVPQNIFESLTQNDVLQMVVFFFLFGAACSAVGTKAQPVVTFANAVAEVMFRYTRYVMYCAPFGVGAAIAVTVGSKGISVLLSLGKLVGALYIAEILFVVLVLGGALIIARVPVGRFFHAVRQPFLIAFSTASSEAALPRSAETHCGICAADGLQFQPRRFDALSVASVYFRRASRRGTHAARHADHDAAYADADEQRCGRCSAGLTGDPGWNPGHIPSPTRRGYVDFGRRCFDGHVPHLGECVGKLCGDSGRRSLGGRVVGYSDGGPRGHTEYGMSASYNASNKRLCFRE